MLAEQILAAPEKINTAAATQLQHIFPGVFLNFTTVPNATTFPTAQTTVCNSVSTACNVQRTYIAILVMLV